jgi:hypothetical protein
MMAASVFSAVSILANLGRLDSGATWQSQLDTCLYCDAGHWFRFPGLPA